MLLSAGWPAYSFSSGKIFSYAVQSAYTDYYFYQYATHTVDVFQQMRQEAVSRDQRLSSKTS